MSPPSPSARPSESIAQAIARASLLIGTRLAVERKKRGWTLRQAAEKAGLSAAVVHAVEAGRTAALETYVRLARAYGLELDAVLVDPRQAARAGGADAVHAAMGDMELAQLSALGFAVGLDEPYQHFQFAGRADVMAWDRSARALLQVENRTRFPDFQQAAGAWNGKRAYLAPQLAKRLGLVQGWKSVTHVMAVAWTAEMNELLDSRRASFRALCPDPVDAFTSWWAGTPPVAGTSATLVVLDPAARRGRLVFAAIDEAVAAGARHRGYAQLAQCLRERTRRRRAVSREARVHDA